VERKQVAYIYSDLMNLGYGRKEHKLVKNLAPYIWALHWISGFN